MATITMPGMLLTGTHGARPAANAVGGGTLFGCSTHGLIYQSDGSSWTQWFDGSGSAALSYGSNSMHVAEISSAGASNAVARADHFHAGIGQVTSSSSNTLQRGTLNFRPGAGMGITASDTDGDGEFDTITLVSSGSGGGGGSSSLTSLDATLGADVTMTTGNTWYNGPSASFAAGTWLFVWHATIVSGATSLRSLFGRVVNSDASVEYDYVEGVAEHNGYRYNLSGGGLVTLVGTTTIKIQASSDQNTNTMSRDGGNGTGHFATRLSAVKIA